MTRSLSPWQSVLLGLVVVVGAALGGVGLFTVGSRGWFGKEALNVLAGFGEIQGVEIGTPVRIRGQVAGEVAEILDPKGPYEPILLRLRIKGRYRAQVLKSSWVKIKPMGMLGGNVVEIYPPVRLPSRPEPDLAPADEDDLLASVPGSDLNESAVKGLATVQQVGDEAVETLRSVTRAAERSKETLGRINSAIDATKKLPLVGGAFKGASDILVRENGEWDVEVFVESDLFEPGRAVLTSQGQTKLDDLGATWLKQRRHPGSEVVVVSYADPKAKLSASNALLVTRQQSETVLEYLKSYHGAHKLAWWGVGPIRTRKVTALGMGVNPPPKPEPKPLPPARIEVRVFKPVK